MAQPEIQTCIRSERKLEVKLQNKQSFKRAFCAFVEETLISLRVHTSRLRVCWQLRTHQSPDQVETQLRPLSLLQCQLAITAEQVSPEAPEALRGCTDRRQRKIEGKTAVSK